jgi:hypothetical protein
MVSGVYQMPKLLPFISGRLKYLIIILLNYRKLIYNILILAVYNVYIYI